MHEAYTMRQILKLPLQESLQNDKYKKRGGGGG